MNKKTIESLISILGGFGLIYTAASQSNNKGSRAEVKEKPKTKGKTGKKQTYEEYLERVGKTKKKQEPNPQRYNVFLDVIERYTQPGMGAWNEMMIMMPAPGSNLNTGVKGTHAGHVRDHQRICDMNENDGKWGSMVFAGEQAINEKVTVRDLTEMLQRGEYNLNSFAVVLVAIPTHAETPEEQLAGAMWHIFGEYASYGDAGRNLMAIMGDVSASCQDANYPFRDIGLL